MKKSSIIYLVGGLLITLGIILIVIAISYGGINFNYLETYKEFKFETTDDFNRIEIVDNSNSVGNLDIIIEGVDRDDFAIYYYQSNQTKIGVEQVGKTLIFTNKSEENAFNLIGEYSEEIKIQVPYDYFSNLTLDIDNSSVRIADVNLDNLVVDQTTGTINLDGVKVSSICSVALDSGRIDADYLDAYEFVVDNPTGGTYVKDSNISNFSVKSVSSEIYLDGSRFNENIDIETTNGKILAYLLGEDDDYLFEIEAKNGYSNVYSTEIVEEIDYSTLPKVKIKSIAGRIQILTLGEEIDIEIK